MVGFDNERHGVKFPGHSISTDGGKAFLEKTAFGQTYLGPATDRTQAWQNQDSAGLYNGRLASAVALATAAPFDHCPKCCNAIEVGRRLN